MTFKQCDAMRNRVCGSHPQGNRLASIRKKSNRTTNIMHFIPNQCYKELPQLINTKVESQDITEYSQTSITTSHFSSIEEPSYEEPAFDIKIEVIKKSLRQDDIAQSSHIEFYYLFYNILCNLI